MSLEDQPLPYVSIAIPFFNSEKTLPDAIRSVFAQTHQLWELILIDDGSVDGSLSLVQAVNDPRVKVYSDGRNRGLAARLNQVTELACYEYIARMDSDDMMDPTRIAKLLSMLVARPEFDLASCGVCSVSKDDTLLGVRGVAECRYTFRGLLDKSQTFVHAGLVARKEWYVRNRYDETLGQAEDTELWLRTVKLGDFRAISSEEPLYMYREEYNVTKKKLIGAYALERDKLAAMIDSYPLRWGFILRSHAKSWVTRALSFVGLLNILIKRRNNAVLKEESVRAFQSACSTIKATYVPGLDHG